MKGRLNDRLVVTRVACFRNAEQEIAPRRSGARAGRNNAEVREVEHLMAEERSACAEEEVVRGRRR